MVCHYWLTCGQHKHAILCHASCVMPRMRTRIYMPVNLCIMCYVCTDIDNETANQTGQILVTPRFAKEMLPETFSVRPLLTI
jgi:hypothetical protein